MENNERELKCKKMDNILSWIVIIAGVIGIATILTMWIYGEDFPINQSEMTWYLLIYTLLVSGINRWARKYRNEYKKLKQRG